MFPCKRCEKSYKSQSSLARHLRNHTVDNSYHSCPVCHVAFSRRDLLVRHMNIHEGIANDRSGSSRNLKPKIGARRRCHTACQPCRNARVKCNGDNPCLTCTLNQRDCRYLARSHRISRINVVGDTLPITPPTQSMEDEDPSLPSPSTADPDIPVPPVHFAMTAREDPSDSLAVLDEPSHDNLVAPSDMASLNPMGFDWTVGYSPNNVSWPWLHESLYLKGNPWDEWTASVDIPNATPSSLNPPMSPNTTLPLGEYCHGPQEISTGSSNVSPLEADAIIQRRRLKSQTRIIEELVTYAARPDGESADSRLCYWGCMSLRVTEAFGIDDWQAAHANRSLMHMLDLYRESFSPLWPLLSGRDFNAGEMHPLLFLTLVSIGAMYGTSSESCFGTAMHEKIRKTLLTPLFVIEEHESSLLPLGQARLLTQVGSLYFGQRRAFSFAQNLGSVLLAQARRMDLFSADRTSLLTSHDSTEDDYFSAWMHVESRKRLAFGFLRADVYMSVLMNSRPLISAEEFELDLPAPDHIWAAPDSPAARQFRDQGPRPYGRAPGLSFADLVRVALDRSEALLDMDLARYELLLFGLQEQVWRFSHDPRLFRRLVGTHEPSEITRRHFIPTQSTGAMFNRWSSPPHADHLAITHRRMNDLTDNRAQLMDALVKWEQSFAAVRTMGTSPSDRTSIMSSVLLCRLSYLRFAAPLPDLHNFGYAFFNKKPVDQRKLEALTCWARSPEARTAAGFSCDICNLVGYEVQQPVEKRAKHNLLAFSGLHHAAIVIWVFAGSQDDDFTEDSLSLSADGEPIMLCRRESTQLIKTIIGLYKKLTPVGWCSFVAVAERLSLHTFPATVFNSSSHNV
jgi:uncharacterized C2H2 Zn-finger protein